MKEEGDIPLEIHTNETIERFNEDVDDELLLRLYHDEENNIYKPIIRTDEEVDDRQIIQPPTKAKSNIKMSIHQNDDIQMLWSVSSELDFSKKFSDGWDWTWQVPRADFDNTMAQEVIRKGIDLEFESEVISVSFKGKNSITVVKDINGNLKEIHAKFIIDSIFVST